MHLYVCVSLDKTSRLSAVATGPGHRLLDPVLDGILNRAQKRFRGKVFLPHVLPLQEWRIHAKGFCSLPALL